MGEGVRQCDVMREESGSQYSPIGDPPSESATVAGTLGFLVLMGGVLLVASYPAVGVAALAGGLLTSLIRRVASRGRRLETPETRIPGNVAASTTERDRVRHPR